MPRPPGMFLIVALCLCVHYVLAFSPPSLPGLFGVRRSGGLRMMMSLADPKPDMPMAPDVRELESGTPPLPHRTINRSGLESDVPARMKLSLYGFLDR